MISQMKKDAEFFINHNILDYSLLVGIAYLKPGESLEIKKRFDVHTSIQ